MLEELINPQIGRDVTKVADDIFSIYDKNPVVIDELKDIVREENFKKGMTYYIAQYKPELKKLLGGSDFLTASIFRGSMKSYQRTQHIFGRLTT